MGPQAVEGGYAAAATIRTRGLNHLGSNITMTEQLLHRATLYPASKGARQNRAAKVRNSPVSGDRSRPLQQHIW